VRYYAEWQGTQGFQINPAGAMVGVYSDSDNVYHGFLRAPDGRISKFDVPGAGHKSGQGTVPTVNNNAGTISGMYLDDRNVFHGFLVPAGLGCYLFGGDRRSRQVSKPNGRRFNWCMLFTRACPKKGVLQTWCLKSASTLT
jgi:hypothetical protein